MAQLVKNPPAMWETWVQSLGWEDPLRRERVPTPVFWPGEFHGHTVHGLQRVRHEWVTFTNVDNVIEWGCLDKQRNIVNKNIVKHLKYDRLRSSAFILQGMKGSYWSSLIGRVMWSYLYFRKINFMDCEGGRLMGPIVHQPRVIWTEWSKIRNSIDGRNSRGI